MIYFLQKFLVFSIPLRELAGFKSGIPFRLGELLMLAYAGWIFIKTSTEKKARFFNRSFLSKNIVYLLILNLVLTIIFSRGRFIAEGFFYKYVARNIMMIIFFTAVLIKPLRLKKRDVELFFKYMVLLQLFMFFLQKIGFTIEMFKIERFPFKSRFQGTASESGYLPTLIAPALWYFRNSIRNKKYYYLAFFEIFMTFSSFGYGVLIIEIIVSLFTKKIRFTPKLFLKKIILSLFLLLVVGINFKFVLQKIEYNLNKIVRYSRNDGGDFSARARSEQLIYIKSEISKFSKYELIVGKGTGGYSYKQFKQIKKHIFMEITEEGHTVYYSTIHDRGLLGYLILLSLFSSFGYMIYKQRKNRVIMSLGYLYILQLIHWKITGNIWLYYFWISMGFVVSQYEIKQIIKKRRDWRKNVLYKTTHISLPIK